MTPGFVYVVRIPNGLVKIGFSVNVLRRVKQFERPSVLLHTIPSNDARALERTLHQTYEAYRVQGEWFNLTESMLAAIHAHGCHCAGQPENIVAPAYTAEVTRAVMSEFASWASSRRKPQVVTCAGADCDKTFEAIKRREGNYCSPACRSRAYRKRRNAAQTEPHP